MSHLSKTLSTLKQEITAHQLKNIEASQIQDENAKTQALLERADAMTEWLYPLDILLSDALYEIQKQEREAKADLLSRPKRVLGVVDFSSGNVVVSDPCYELGTWCQHILTGVKTGRWIATKTLSDEGDWGVRVAQLEAYIDEEPKDEDFTHLQNADIGVDSGQAGFFEKDGYRNASLLNGKTFSLHSFFMPKPEDSKEKQDSDVFYGACGALTLSSEQAGVFPGSVVSSSGYGDGSYDLYVRRDAEGEITAMRLVFIGDDEEEDDE